MLSSNTLSGVKQHAPVASVNPYPTLILAFEPCACKKSFTLSRRVVFKASPPHITDLTHSKSFEPILLSSKASYKVGTPAIKVGLFFRIISPNFLKLKDGIKIAPIPTERGVWIQTPSPKPWKIGKIDKTVVPGTASLITVVQSSARALKFKLDKSIPFGLPVVPPLYKITAGSYALRCSWYSPW